MDKIKKKWPDNVELRGKVNELIERLEDHISFEEEINKVCKIMNEYINGR